MENPTRVTDPEEIHVAPLKAPEMILRMATVCAALDAVTPSLRSMHGPIYLAQPFYAPDPETRRARVEAGRAVTLEFLNRSLPVYSPIVFSAGLAGREMRIPETAWLLHGMSMVSACTALVVLCLPGWKSSRGVSVETTLATMLDKPIIMLDAGV